jgi:hypothetical protein
MNNIRSFSNPYQKTIFSFESGQKLLFILFFSIFSLTYSFAQTNPNLEGKQAVKLINQQESTQLLLGYTQGKLKALPNDGHAQAMAAKLDFMPVNYRNKNAGVYIFLNSKEQVLVRSFDGKIQLKNFANLSSCELEYARWDYSMMMTGGPDDVFYQFSSKSSTEPERWLIVDKNRNLMVTTDRGQDGTIWIANESVVKELKKSGRN